MNINDYEFVDLTGGQFEALAKKRPLRAERLLDELESFVQRDTSASARVYPTANGSPVEVYMVLSPWVLRHLPDAAVIVSVDHSTKQIKAIRVIEDSDGDATDASWASVCQTARDQVDSARK